MSKQFNIPNNEHLKSHIDFDKAKWFKAKSSQTTNCVEVAFVEEGYVAVRDTKDRDGGTLVYTPSEWAAFVEGVRLGEFDQPVR